MRDMLRGVLSPELDSIDAEIQEHYERHGYLIAGPAILDAPLPRTGKLLALQVASDPANPRYVLTHAEREQGWLDERTILGPFLKKWTNDQLSNNYFDAATNPTLVEAGKHSAEVIWVGAYVTLEREPPIVRSAADVALLLYPNAADPLAEMIASYGPQIQTHSAVIVAFRYPERHTNRLAWLFLSLRVRPRATDQVKDPQTGLTVPVLDFTKSREQQLASAEIGVIRIQDFRRQHLQLRNERQVPADVETLSFSMAGLGALGSTMADLIAKAGVGSLRLYDLQILEAGNVLRHIGPLTEVCEAKVAVVARSILTHNPYCRVEFGDNWSVLQAAPEKLFGTTAVISTIADDATELALNEIAVDSRATVYYLRALRRGTVARLIRVRPGVDACLDCARLYLQDDASPLVIPRLEVEAVGHECGSPILAASGADLTAAAAIAVRRILDDASAPGQRNHWLWTTEGVLGHAALSEPLSGTTATLAPQALCPTCAGRDIDAVVLSAEVWTDLSQRVHARLPAETGGILIGRRDGRRIIITTATGAGPNATEERTKFLRDGVFCQQMLREAMESDPHVTYVGEWHSHPKGPVWPSARDVQSLREISVDSDSNTEAPVMIIVALPAEGPAQQSATIYPANRPAYPLQVIIHEH
jgi:integrative and conjugative element protein (TIGR02256 family)